MDTDNIIYNDGTLIALNKPAGLVAYRQGTPSEAVLATNGDLGTMGKDAYDLVCELTGIDRKNLRAVNRLDKGTSGIMLFCTSKKSARHYSNLIKNRKIHKEYVALVRGRWDEAETIITYPVKACSKRSYVDMKNGKTATTRIVKVKNFNEFSLLNLVIETGRKHQIRTHMASMDHPIAGDELYGGGNNVSETPLLWPLLHSVKTKIPQREGKKLELIAPLPPLFKMVIKLLTTLIISILFLTPAMATDLSLYRNSAAKLIWEIPAKWKRTTPPKGNSGDTAVGISRSWFSFADGMGQLMISCEESPVSDLNSLSIILTDLIKNKKMKIDKLPETVRYGKYEALRIVSPPETDHPMDLGRIFVYFTGFEKEVSFKMAASSRIWEQSLKTFKDSLSTINIGILHQMTEQNQNNEDKIEKSRNNGTVLSDSNGLWSVVIPASYRNTKSGKDNDLFRIFKDGSKSSIEFSVAYCPAINETTLMEFFTTNAAMAGLIISKCATNHHNQWPAVTIEALADVEGQKVNLYYRLIQIHQFVFNLTGLCPLDEEPTFKREFIHISRSIKIGGDYYGDDRYINPSSLSQSDSHIKTTLIETVAAIHPRNRVESEKVPRGTLSLMIPFSYSPYQEVDVEGWSQMPDTLRADSLLNIENLFYLNEPGRKARERVGVKYRVTATRTMVTPMKGPPFKLPPALRYRYTVSSTNVPFKHPRVVSFSEKWGINGKEKSTSEIVETLLKAVNLYTRAPKKILRRRESKTSKLQWGSGALFALAHPATCGPSERVDLLAAALRDQNIPVRRLYGHLLNKSGKNMTAHVWCEVFIAPAGWVPADPTSIDDGKMPVLGLWSERYILISREGPGFIIKSGPDRAFLEEGHSRARTKPMNLDIEVTRAITGQ